jgi:hypothetical protein
MLSLLFLQPILFQNRCDTYSPHLEVFNILLALRFNRNSASTQILNCNSICHPFVTRWHTIFMKVFGRSVLCDRTTKTTFGPRTRRQLVYFAAERSIFWLLAPCRSACRCNVSGRRTAFIIRAYGGNNMFARNACIGLRLCTAPKHGGTSFCRSDCTCMLVKPTASRNLGWILWFLGLSDDAFLASSIDRLNKLFL